MLNEFSMSERSRALASLAVVTLFGLTGAVLNFCFGSAEIQMVGDFVGLIVA